MRLLRDQPPRPRSTAAAPAYPRLMAAGLLAVVSSACGGEVAGVSIPERQNGAQDPDPAPVTSTAGLPPLPYTAPDAGAGAAGGAPAAEPGDDDYNPGGAGAASYEDVPGGTAGTAAEVADEATGGTPEPVEVGVGGGGMSYPYEGLPVTTGGQTGGGGGGYPMASGAGAAPYLDEEPRGGSAGALAKSPDPAGAGGFSFDEGQPSSGAAGASAEVPGPSGAAGAAGSPARAGAAGGPAAQAGAEPAPVYDP